MQENRSFIHFTWRENAFYLWRLRDEEYDRIRPCSLPILEDSLFLIRLFLIERDNPDRLTLPKAFLALQKLFGESSEAFDRWKGSFCFPLLLRLEKRGGNFYYLLKVYDHRGSLNVGLYRVLENGSDEYNTDRYREPFELEFSREEINQFIGYFQGYLNVFFQTIPRESLSPFLKRIDSNWILYGYDREDIFEREFESEEEYRQAIASFEERYETSIKEAKTREIRALLQNITGER